MVKKLDKWCDNLWIYFMCVVGAATAVYLILNWGELPLGAKGGAFVAIIMPLHVIEEWKLPGGLHYFYNVLFGSKETELNRYPMSRLTDMVTNIGMQWFPLLFLLLSNVAGLSAEISIAMMLFCFIEVLAHTIAGTVSLVRYRKAGKRTIYNPGFATSYLLFLPAGLYLVFRLPGMSAGNWIGGLVALAITLICCIPLSETPLKRWVLKQGGNAFAFKSAKYFSKFIEQR